MLPTIAVYLLICDYYFKGDRIVLSNFKTAAGVFEQDKYLALIQGVVNLILSIALVQKIGIAGIYVGTVVSGLIANITKPVIIYKVCFDKSSLIYFKDSMKYMIMEVIITGICYLCSLFVLKDITIVRFGIMVILVTVIFNGLFLLVFHRSEEFGYIFNTIKGKLSNKA